MILLKIVIIISTLTMLISSTQQTFAMIGSVGGGSAGATTGAGSAGQIVDPHLEEKFCTIPGMKTPICK